MQTADFNFVSAGTPNSQRVAVLEAPGKIEICHALIPEPGADELRIKIPCLLEGDDMVDALDACAFGGRIVMYGCIGTCNVPFDFFKMHKKRVDIYSTEPKSEIAMRRFWQEGLHLVEDGLVNTVDMVTHRFLLDRVAEAFRLRDDKRVEGAIHILIDCGG